MIHMAFSVSAVAAIMLPAIEMRCLCLISAEVMAIFGSTSTVLKSFCNRVVRSLAVSRPSFWSVNR